METLRKTLWEVFGEPYLTSAGLYEAPDRTYGRADIPFSPMEQRLHQNPDVTVWFGKAMMPNGKDFTWYQVWEDKAAQARTGRNADMIFVHGTGVHGGTLASHSRRYLENGFRLIVPDLPSHGYSTGLHVYQESIRGYTAGLHAVLHDVARRDDALSSWSTPTLKCDRKTTFMLGLSFGGLVALFYALHFPASLRQDTSDDKEIPIDGILAVGPMIGYSTTNVYIPKPLEYMIRLFQSGGSLGRVELLVPHKRCLDKDPKVYKTLVSEDKRSHQGAFRLGHIAAIQFGMVELRERAGEIKHPIFVQQGGQDRVVHFEQCLQFVRDLGTDDKRCTVYPVCQHVIYRKAKTEEEDQAGRVVCIEDNTKWMCERSMPPGQRDRQESKASISSELTVFDEGPGCHPMEDDSTPPVWDRNQFPSTPFVSTPEVSLVADEEAAGFFTAAPIASESKGAFFDASQPMPVYDSSNSNGSSSDGSVNGDDDDATVTERTLNHPLLAKAHPTTLPLLARIAPRRSYRKAWKLDDELRPYDINIDAIRL
ncbi:unnamed protein product [Jaminaea pallidilutea]